MDNEDTWRWLGEEKGIYTVKSAYKYLENSCTGENTNTLNTFWEVKVIPPAQHFAWQVMLNKVPTRENLVRRGYN